MPRQAQETRHRNITIWEPSGTTMPSRRVVASSKDEVAGHPKNAKLWSEEEVLQPVSPQANPNDWPCFVLKEAVVYKKDSPILGNLLHAEADGPMIVRGNLEVDKDLRGLQIVRNLKGVQVEVKNVLSFSIAIGPITIWALGRTGWFEIRPARMYRPIYEKMVEGIKLYYFLTDIHEGSKDYKKPSEIGKLFDQYARKFDMSMTPPQVVKLFEDNAKFLLSQMRKQTESIRWSNTCIYRWLVDGSPMQSFPQEKTGKTTNKGQEMSPKLEQSVRVKFSVRENGSAKTRAGISQTRTSTDLESVASKRSILQPDGAVRPRQLSGLRLPSASLNRSFSSEDENQNHKSRKRRRISPSLNNNNVELSDQGSDNPDAEEDEGETVELKFRAEPIPISEPQGPNGLWTCYVKGCRYSIASADEPESKEKIRAHFLEHADELDAREQLVLQEARPHMPVTYLLEKLRRIGESVRLAEQSTIGGRIVPLPIKKQMTI